MVSVHEKECDLCCRRSWELGAHMIGTGSEARVGVIDPTARAGSTPRCFYQSLGRPIMFPSLQEALADVYVAIHCSNATRF